MELKALVLFSPGKAALHKAAQHVEKGCKIAGAHAEILPYDKARHVVADLSGFGIIFIGFHATRFGAAHDALSFLKEHKASLSAKPVAVFFTLGAFAGKKQVERALAEIDATGAIVKNTLSLHLQGPLALIGRGHLRSIDLIRAEAFSERTVNYLTGTRVVKTSEKHAIKGYRK